MGRELDIRGDWQHEVCIAGVWGQLRIADEPEGRMVRFGESQMSLKIGASEKYLMTRTEIHGGYLITDYNLDGDLKRVKIWGVPMGFWNGTPVFCEGSLSGELDPRRFYTGTLGMEYANRSLFLKGDFHSIRAKGYQVTHTSGEGYNLRVCAGDFINVITGPEDDFQTRLTIPRQVLVLPGMLDRGEQSHNKNVSDYVEMFSSNRADYSPMGCYLDWT